jgi:hypothetical protein
MTESSAQIERELMEAIKNLAEIEAGTKELAEEVRDYVVDEAPVKTGDYAAGIKVRQGKPVAGMSCYKVVATDFKSHWVEFGTGDPGPTKERAPMGKAAYHFGGTLDDGVTAE